MADGIPPPPPGFNIDPQPVYGAAPKPPTPPTGYAPVTTPATPVKPIPGGPADPTRITPDPGYHLGPDGQTEIPNKGGPHDPNNPETALTQDALDDTTAKLILTNQMDPMGMGGGPVRLQILNNRPVMLRKYGITDQQLPSIQAQFKADSNAYNQRVQQLSFIQQATDAANQHIHQIAGYLQQLPAQTDARALNAVSNFAQRQMSGQTITNLDTTIPLLQSEMAKIMTANPSGAATLTDDARHEFDILQSNVSPQAKLQALAALQQMGVGKVNGLKTEIDGLHARLTGGLQTYAQLAHSGILGAGPGGTPPGSPPAGPTGPGNGTDPNIQNVGGFRDQLTYNPQGAEQFHDALFAAAKSGAFSSVQGAQNWATAYNKAHGTDFGVADTPQTEQAVSAAAAHKPFSVDIPQMTQTEAARMQQRVAADKSNQGTAAAATGAADSLTVGALKPIIAAGDTAVDALTGKQADYTGNLNAATGYLDTTRQNAPVPYIGGELAGALALPSFGARSVPEFARLGAGYGGLYGFNSSAGQPLANKLLNTATGAVAGAALPIALGAAAKGIGAVRGGVNSLLNIMPEKTPELPVGFDPAALASAGQQEHVTVNRAMIDPTADAKTTAVGKTMVGGPSLRSGMNKVANQISDRTQTLGNGGTALESQDAGNAVSGAGLRYITQTGAQFNRLYGSLQKATAGMKIPATQASAEVDDLITHLSEMPNQNAKEIAYLQGLKQDLSQPLSIDALRGLRTNIRQTLAKGDLTFGPQEARVQGIADAAAQDITNGLTAAGKTNTAAQFQQVDAAYRDRMNMIQGTIQKLIGKRGQDLSGEQVFANLKSMAGPRGDASGLTRMIEQMSPDEQKDIRATFADALGKSPKGDFSTAYLVTQAQKMPQAMRVAVFGQDGAQRLNNLVTLAKAHSRVQNALGGSPTGTANDYRDWLHMLLIGGGEGIGVAAMTHSSPETIAAAVAPAAIKATRDAMNARLLLNKDIQGWLKSAPATSSQRAIDVHFARLNAIAAKNPALAADIGKLRQSIMSAANSNVPHASSAAASPNDGPQQQTQAQ